MIQSITTLPCRLVLHSRYLLEVGLSVAEPDAVDESSQSRTLLQSAPVVAPEVLGQLLGVWCEGVGRVRGVGE